MIEEWLTCPVCESDPECDRETEVEVGLDHQHLRFECQYCGSVVKRFHADHELLPDP